MHSCPPKAPLPRIAPSSAFSLVEVTMAIGLVGVCVLTLLGIMPIGLDTMRDAMDTTVRAQIAQRVAGEALLMPSSKLGDYIGKSPFFFSQEGLAQTSRDTSTRFEVTLLKRPTVYPGSSQAEDLDKSITTLELDIKLAVGSSPASTYVVQIPNSGE